MLRVQHRTPLTCLKSFGSLVTASIFDISEMKKTIIVISVGLVKSYAASVLYLKLLFKLQNEAFRVINTYRHEQRPLYWMDRF